MAVEFFAAQARPIPNPLRPYAVLRVSLGIGLTIVGLLLVAGLVAPLSELLSQLRGRASEGSTPLVIMRAVVAVSLLVAGLKALSEGIGAFGRILVPPRAPADMATQEVVTSMTRRELPAYAVVENEPYWLLRRWLPNQFPLMTRRHRHIVNVGLTEIMRTLWVVGAVAVGVLLLRAFSPQHANVLIGPWFWTYLACLVVGTGAYVWGALSGLPTASPRAELSEFGMQVRGGGDPNHIPHSLEHELGILRPSEGTPNRVARLGFDMLGGGVTESGKFEGMIFVENQPVLVEGPAQSQSVILLAAGASAQAIALAWWLHPPGQEGWTLDALVIAGIFQWIGALRLHQLGGRMLQAAKEFLQSFRFHSSGVLLNIEGNFARSELRVGRGRDDSIETSNLVVRSDCSVTGYVAALLTESRELMGPRHVIAMALDETSRRVEELVRDWMSRFERQAATVVGLDLEDRKVMEMRSEERRVG